MYYSFIMEIHCYKNVPMFVNIYKKNKHTVHFIIALDYNDI